MNIDALKSAISVRGGLASANRFKVTFNLPGAVGNIDQPEHITLLMEQVTLPSRSIATLDYVADKQSNKFPYTHIDGDVTMTFIITNDFFMQNLFQDWLNTVIDVEQYKLGYKKEYVSEVTIQSLDPHNQVTHEVTLENAFPIDLAVVTLNNTDTEYLRGTVTFAYDKYVVKDGFSAVNADDVLIDNLETKKQTKSESNDNAVIAELPTKNDEQKNNIRRTFTIRL